MQHWEDTDEFYDGIAEGKVLVKVGSAFCQPCKQIQEILEEEENKHDYTFASVAMEDMTPTLVQMDVAELPTIIFFSDGEETERLVGYHPKEVLSVILERWGEV